MGLLIYKVRTQICLTSMPSVTDMSVMRSKLVDKALSPTMKKISDAQVKDLMCAGDVLVLAAIVWGIGPRQPPQKIIAGKPTSPWHRQSHRNAVDMGPSASERARQTLSTIWSLDYLEVIWHS
jgi:hypothetical protein